MLGRKPSAFCDKLFDRIVKTAFQVYMGTSWAETLSDENLTLSCSDIERKIFTFVREFFDWVVRTAFFVSRSVLWIEYFLQESCRVLFITFGLSDKKSCFLAEKYRHLCQKCIPTVRWNNLRGGFLWKSFLAIFRDLAKKNSVFPRINFYAVVKAAFHGPRGAF